ncbi:MAG: protein tyrosine phosphatase family protein [Paraperlucidibaca sp.]
MLSKGVLKKAVLKKHVLSKNWLKAGWLISFGMASVIAVASALPAGYHKVSKTLSVSGYVHSKTQIEALKAEGVQVVISLLPDGEQTVLDEAEAVKQAGLSYVSIPVAGAADLTEANVRALDRALAEHVGEKVLVHCASGNRVGALLALRANWLLGASPEEAIAIGQAAGMTRLEAAVRELLR